MTQNVKTSKAYQFEYSAQLLFNIEYGDGEDFTCEVLGVVLQNCIM